MKKAGLIGVGLLGSALAYRFSRDGIEVNGFDRNQDALDGLSGTTGLACGSAAEVLRNCDQVVLSLPDSDVVTSLIQQHLGDMREGQIVLDTTTGDPQQAVSIGQSLAEVGVHYLEATVAGSSEQVKAGNVALFLGGDTETVTQAEPLLKSITPRRFHLGPVGNGSRFKLVHNLVLGLHRAVLAEGLVFAEDLGFSSEETLRILRETPAVSGVMDTKGKRMVDRDYEAQARVSQHLKDVRLILSSAARLGSKVPLSKMHESLLEQAEQLGFGEADNSAVIEAYRNSTLRDDR
ncbi:MAG: NAD(P)-dependent oxidoreductase [Rubripirellula sp.]